MAITAVSARRKMSEIPISQLLEISTPMKAEEFCDRWFKIDQLPEEAREAAREVRGYRAKCVRLLSAVLNKSEKTINNWGHRFENMPQDLQTALQYMDVIRQQVAATPDEILKLLMDHRNDN